jgi:hypothetical protein
MSRIYLVNVGANTSHAVRARSPIFKDGSFKYVSFPYRSADVSEAPAYPKDVASFVRMEKLAGWETHADPDWPRLTYGDYCRNPRAAALAKVQPGDTLLFWGLLWENRGSDWSGFTGAQGWYLLGAMRVKYAVGNRADLMRLPRSDQSRARANAHFAGGSDLDAGHRVFLGDEPHSIRFAHAVDLEALRPDGLLFKAFTMANRSPLASSGKPHWSSCLRACRVMWDLDHGQDRARAKLVQRAIARRNSYDLLEGL